MSLENFLIIHNYVKMGVLDIFECFSTKNFYHEAIGLDKNFIKNLLKLSLGIPVSKCLDWLLYSMQYSVVTLSLAPVAAIEAFA